MWDRIDAENIKEQLKEGALKRAARDRSLVEKWFDLEEEVCQKSQN